MYRSDFSGKRECPVSTIVLRRTNGSGAVLVGTVMLKGTSSETIHVGPGLANLWASTLLESCWFSKAPNGQSGCDTSGYRGSISTSKHPSSFSNIPGAEANSLFLYSENSQPSAWPGIVGGTKPRLACPCTCGSGMICQNCTQVKRCDATRDIGFLCDSESCTALYATHHMYTTGGSLCCRVTVWTSENFIRGISYQSNHKATHHDLLGLPWNIEITHSLEHIKYGYNTYKQS